MEETRLKIRAQDQAGYRDLLTLLRGRGELKLASTRRHFVVVSSLPTELAEAIAALGCTISPDHRYDLES